MNYPFDPVSEDLFLLMWVLPSLHNLCLEKNVSKVF